MARERAVAEGAEDRDVSDGSVEEISEEDFKHDGGGRAGAGGAGGGGRSARVWRNGYRMYPAYMSQHHAFSNFAWMQAVKNKPLGLAFGDAAAGQEVQGAGSHEVCVVSDSGDEKEEGEIEEGEIEDGDSSEVVVVDEANCGNSEALECGEDGAMRVCAEGTETGDEGSLPEAEIMELDDSEDLDHRVGLILEYLEMLTEEEVEKSFGGACSRALRALERLQKMLQEGHAIFIDVVIQQAFTAIGNIHSVYLKTKEMNEEAHARFLLRIKGLHSALFTADQMKEINDMVPSLQSQIMDERKTDQLVVSSASVSVAAAPSHSGLALKTDPPALKPLVIKKTKEFSQFLDPHANHDEDSLPSPTSKTGSSLVAPKATSVEQNATSQPVIKNLVGSNNPMYPYVTDALKAVSTYHKKYDRMSFLSNDRLPSPTPSEDGENGDNDIHGEVSSSSSVGNINSVPFMPAASFPSGRGVYTDHQSGIGPVPFRTADQNSYESKAASKVSVKSRDPRLRLVTSNLASASPVDKQSLIVEPDPKFCIVEGSAIDPRKHKAMGGPFPGDHPVKRQRHDLSSFQAPQFVAGKGGWLENNGGTVIKPVNASQQENIGIGWGIRQDSAKVTGGFMDIGSKHVPTASSANIEGNQVQPTGSISAATLPSLLKDLASNPAVLMHLIRVAGNQKLTSNNMEPSSVFSDVNKPTIQGSSADNTIMKCLQPEQKSDLRTPISSEMPSSTNLASDAGKQRMKPRDPRRVLQNSMLHKSERLASPQIKADAQFPMNPHGSNDMLSVREHGEQAQNSGMPSQSTTTTDITSQLTKNLKIIANMMSVPQGGSVVNPPTSSKVDDGIAKGITTKGANGLPMSSSLSGERTPEASHSEDPWGDVDHLLDGYDDQQKAAIQRERARRIEEQNKMFSARKLSLVLDLDHTLLNSAKFVEVDLMHDEILRKKEEMDRERPQRHLFRFQHMSMWTKLRPGIWTFLEKANKLYELHLYTMGNHLYATEMAKVLDPTGSLFAGRVISKGDDNDPLDGDERVPKTKDLEGVKGMESAVVIIDDSVKVWPHNKLNLIVVERYTYFPCSRRQFGLMGPSLLEIDHDERPEDGTLASALAVIERIHHNFFSYPSLENIDVRNILAAEQRKILSGCRIVFSRIFPVGEANPHLHPLWQTAEQFGAVCTNQIDDQVTHVVANSLGTDKVNWALSTGRYVVHHGWVEASALLYRRANELDFAVKP